MDYFHYLLRVLAKGVSVSIRTAVFVGGTLAIVGGALSYFFPDLSSQIGITAWILPISLFVLLFVVRILLAPYWLYMEEAGKVSSLEEELAEFKSTAPNLAFVDARQAQMYRPSPVADKKIKIFKLLQVWFENRPDIPSEGSVAKQLTATIEYRNSGTGHQLFKIHGQWAQSTAPDHVGHSGVTPQIDLAPGTLYAKLMLAVKYPDEQAAYAYSAESLRDHIDGRNPALELPVGDYQITVEIRGIGVDQTFAFLLTNPGKGGDLDLSTLTQVSSDNLTAS